MSDLAGLTTDWAAEAWQDVPLREGYYKLRQPGPEHWSKRPWRGVYIWHGPPPDPITGLAMDRSPQWLAMLDGDLVDINVVWPWAAKNPVSEAEYEELMR